MSGGLGRIRKGFSGRGERKRACGGVRTKKEERGERSQSLSQSFFVRTPPQTRFISPRPPSPLPIFQDPADEVRVEEGIIRRKLAGRGM